MEEGLEYWIFENGLLRDHRSRLKLWRKGTWSTHEMLNMTQSYMILEENLNTWFENLASADTNLAAQQERSLIVERMGLIEECGADTTNTPY